MICPMSFDVSVSKILELLQNCPNETTRGFANHHKRLKADSKDKKKVYKIFILLIIFSLSLSLLSVLGFLPAPNPQGGLSSQIPRFLCFRFLGFQAPNPKKLLAFPKPPAFFAFRFWGFTPPKFPGRRPSGPLTLSLLLISNNCPKIFVFCLRSVVLQ